MMWSVPCQGTSLRDSGGQRWRGDWTSLSPRIWTHRALQQKSKRLTAKADGPAAVTSHGNVAPSGKRDADLRVGSGASISSNFSLRTLSKHSRILSRSMSPQWFSWFFSIAFSQHEFVLYCCLAGRFCTFPLEVPLVPEGARRVILTLVGQPSCPSGRPRVLRAGACTRRRIVVITCLLELTLFFF